MSGRPQRERLLACGTDVHAPGEEDLLAFYLQDADASNPEKHGFGDTGGHDLIVLPEGEWDDVYKSPERAARDLANEESYAWDELIDRFAKQSMEGTLILLYFTRTGADRAGP